MAVYPMLSTSLAFLLYLTRRIYGSGDNMTNWNETGWRYLKEKQFEKAAEAFNQAIEANPKDPIGYTNFGNLLLRLHDPEKAVPFFERAIALDEACGAAHYGLGNAYYELKRFEEAIPSYQLAEKNGVSDGDLHYMLGMAYFHLEQKRMALVHLQRAVELNQADLEARFQYALCLGALGEVDLAIEHFKCVLDQDDRHADSYYNLGVAYAYKEVYAKARHCFEKALAIQPDHLLAANGLKQVDRLENGSHEKMP